MVQDQNADLGLDKGGRMGASEVCFRHAESKTFPGYSIGTTEYALQQHKHGIKCLGKRSGLEIGIREYLHGGENHH